MKRLLVLAPLLCLLAASPAEAVAPPEPLKQLCDMICGGTWSPDHPPAPDEVRTSMSFAYDAATQTVVGTIVATGGIATHTDHITETFAYDADADRVTVTRVKNEDREIVGTATIGAGTFHIQIGSFWNADETWMISVRLARLENVDIWIEDLQSFRDGKSAGGDEERFLRTSP